MIIAAVCLIAAVVLFLRQRLDAAFVLGALAVVAWFLGYRVQMKQIIASDIQSTRGDESDDEDN